jgi:hypothetical protein
LPKLEHAVILPFLAMIAIALAALGLRAVFLGVCERLEADDLPPASGIRYVEPGEKAPDPSPRRRRVPTPRALAHAGRR